MTEEAQLNLDTETQRCSVEIASMETEMSWLQDQVKRHNADAASARSQVLIAQGNIKTLEELLRDTTIKFEQHKVDCERELNALNAELSIVLEDIKVMAVIIGLIDCSGGSSASSSFVQCAHCDNGIMLQHEQIQTALGKLKSQVARDLVKNSMVKPGVFTQGGFQNTPDLPVGGVNVSDVPVAPIPFDCQPTNKCTIGTNPNCQKLLDKFLVCQAGVTDRKAELEEEIYNKQKFCEEQTASYTQQIGGINTRLRKERGDLATATKRQNENEEGSHQKSAQHAELAAEYSVETKTCCDNKNQYISELCALEKIRGEVSKIKGKDLYFIDCAVSDWSDEECSVTCGGGTMQRVRSILTQPQGGGVPCPPLSAVVSCNEQTCPVDCQLNDWEGWSSCSADCGGGVKERTRSVIIDANHGGEPCEETEEEEACNIQDCDEPCVLAEWNAWSSCSKMCGGGTQRRTRAVAVEAKGTGHCPEPTEQERIHYKDCNDFTCTEFLPTGRDTLRCESKLDIILVLDSSGSLGSEGWKQSYKLASSLIKALVGGQSNFSDVKLGLEIFSGPKTWDDYVACTRNRGTTEIDMKETCGIEWFHHLNAADTNTTLLEKGEEVGRFTEEQWIKSTTLTSVALGQAQNELFNGREDANSAVLVITDGWPLSQRNTKAAARRLQEEAKVVWVPVGASAPRKLIEQLASVPEKDHVISITNFEDMTSNWAINQLVSVLCPRVG